MSDIKPGDEIVCVNSGRLRPDSKGPLPPVRLHAEYIANRMKTCECGRVSIDVGLGLNEGSTGVSCPCGAKSSPLSGIWWCAAQRFAKKKKGYSREEYEEALKNEDYEKLAEIKKSGIPS